MEPEQQTDSLVEWLRDIAGIDASLWDQEDTSSG